MLVRVLATLMFLVMPVAVVMALIAAMFFFLVLMACVTVAMFTMTMFWVVMPSVAMPCTRGELFRWQFFFSGGNHVHFRSADAATVDAGDLQTRIHAQGRHRLGKKLRRNPGIHQGAKEHVAANAGKAL
jgi:hypothetical protein